MTDHSGDADLAQNRVQSFLWGTTQPGDTYVPGKESKQSRSKRVKKVIQGIGEQFPNPHPPHGQAQGGQSSGPSNATANAAEHHYTYCNGTTADLNGVGQQFQDYGHR